MMIEEGKVYEILDSRAKDISKGCTESTEKLLQCFAQIIKCDIEIYLSQQPKKRKHSKKEKS